MAFTFVYSAFVGSLSAGLVGIAVFALESRQWSGMRAFVSGALARVVGAAVVGVLILWIHGWQPTMDYVVVVLLWVLAGLCLDYAATRGQRTAT